jgi:putative DNA primase/helicase
MIRFDIDKTKKVSVNLLNGTVFFDNGFKIRKFDYKDFFTYQLTFDYNIKKECPLFMNYLNKVLPCQQTQDMLQEFSGYIFTKNTMLKLEKVAVLFGIGSNGKSVFFDIISAILGEENKISLSLTDLQQEHYRAMIVDKLLCYSSEMGKGTDHDLFKKLASGEPISARHKYGKAFTAENYCRFMFNTNELPSKVEHTDAFFRRFLIIPFNVQISDEEKDPNLARKIIENELPGVFNWILEGLARLTKTKRFTISKESESILYDFMTEQDSVKKWLDGFIEKEDGGRVLKFYLDDGYKNYKGYCDADGFRPVGKKNFSNRILNNGYDKRRDGAGIFFEENIPF